jgi:hypothetical protein
VQLNLQINRFLQVFTMTTARIPLWNFQLGPRERLRHAVGPLPAHPGQLAGGCYKYCCRQNIVLSMRQKIRRIKSRICRFMAITESRLARKNVDITEAVHPFFYCSHILLPGEDFIHLGTLRFRSHGPAIDL